jgi:signal transduction histidine kinase
MTLTSLIVVVTFAAIFVITLTNERTGESKQLEEIFDSYHSNKGSFTESITQSFTASFVIMIDKAGGVSDKSSSVTKPDSFYEEAAKAVSERATGEIKLSGRIWKYISDEQIEVKVEFDNDESAVINTANVETKAAFLDVTTSREATTRLGRLLAISAVVVIILIFFISLFFSRKAVRPAEEAWEKQKQFVAYASHELKTPLTIIMSNIGVLTASPDETVASQMKWLQRIQSGCDRMNGLIKELLLLAQMDAEHETKAETFSISEVLTDLLSEEAARIKQKQIEVTTKIDDATTTSDRDKVKQLLSILLDNAVKYANDSGSVELLLTKSARFVEIIIRNSGDGIAAKDLPMVFERFYRGENSAGKEDSYGLGLPLAKAIAEKLGGKVTIDSVPNEMTTVTVRLSVKRD